MIYQNLVDHLACLIEMAGSGLVVYLLQRCIAVGVNRRGKTNRRGEPQEGGTYVRHDDQPLHELI